jgi:hypothetical protein
MECEWTKDWEVPDPGKQTAAAAAAAATGSGDGVAGVVDEKLAAASRGGG